MPWVHMDTLFHKEATNRGMANRGSPQQGLAWSPEVQPGVSRTYLDHGHPTTLEPNPLPSSTQCSQDDEQEEGDGMKEERLIFVQ